MANETHLKGKGDRGKAPNKRYAFRDLEERFCVTEETVRLAMKAVGHNRKAVEEYLRKAQNRS